MESPLDNKLISSLSKVTLERLITVGDSSPSPILVGRENLLLNLRHLRLRRRNFIFSVMEAGE